MDDDYRGLFIDVEDQEDFWVVWIMKNESQIVHEMILYDCKGSDDAVSRGRAWIDDYIAKQSKLRDVTFDEFGEWP